jgi:hypothetical protein
MPIPLLLMAAAGSAAKGVSTLLGGVAQSRAFKAQALGAQIERDMARLRGTQIGERSREDLLSRQQNIDSIRTARGASLDSQTGQLIERRTMRDAYRDEGVARLGELNREGAAEQARRGFRTAARWAIPMAALNSLGDFASAGSYGRAGMSGGGK